MDRTWRMLDDGRFIVQQQTGMNAGKWFFKDEPDTNSKRKTAYEQFVHAGCPINVAWAKAFSQYPRVEVPIELIPKEE